MDGHFVCPSPQARTRYSQRMAVPSVSYPKAPHIMTIHRHLTLHSLAPFVQDGGTAGCEVQLDVSIGIGNQAEMRVWPEGLVETVISIGS